jgi:excisionase family DNA binding protein
VINRFTPIEELPDPLRPGEVSAKLACSKGLIYEMCRRGDLDHFMCGRLLRIPRSAVVKLLAGSNGSGHE